MVSIATHLRMDLNRSDSDVISAGLIAPQNSMAENATSAKAHSPNNAMIHMKPNAKIFSSAIMLSLSVMSRYVLFCQIDLAGQRESFFVTSSTI